ncbi:MAG: tyrosine-type recombinase/integrase [Desulfobacteraceae bacterium]|nr:tyrosine-type recombinase/integrase [Desulfobacteraceae bacterium]
MDDQDKNKPVETSQKSPVVFEKLKEVPQEILWLANFNSENTRVTYEKALMQFMAFLGISTTDQLRQVERSHVIAYKEHLVKQGYKPRTINLKLTTLSSLFTDLAQQQVVEKNPVAGVRRLPLDYTRVEAKNMTPDQVRAMLDAPDQSTVKGKRDYALLCTYFYTGCRISEPLNLKVKDFYEESGYHKLDFTIKGGKRNRLAIHAELARALKAYLEQAGHARDKEAYLFLPTCHGRGQQDPGRHMVRQTVHGLFKKYAHAAGVPEDRSTHSARTVFITQALENNCSIDHVQKSVGHTLIKTTQMYDQRGRRDQDSASFAVRY